VSRSSHGAVLYDTLTASLRNPRIWLLLAGLFLAVHVMHHPLSVLPAMAQEAVDPAAEEASVSDDTLADEPVRGTRSDQPEIKPWTWIDTFKAGGTIGAIIILLSFVAVGLVVEHVLTIRKSRIMPEPLMNDLEQFIAQGRIQDAIDYCYEPRNASLATDVVLAGLERFQTTEFGFAEFKAACEEAGEEGTAKLYRKIDLLNLIGVIAPMLGLLGTVAGMITAFNIIASSKAKPDPTMLAGGISQALVTTLEGLLVAIPAMVAYSLFRSQIDHLVAETGKRVERIMSPLGRRR